jgi:tRNA 2-thiouridine synthesizing protein A
MEQAAVIVKTLDLEGMLCPMPVVKLAKAIKEIGNGEILEATATDAGVMADIPAWCKSTGNELLELTREDKIFRFQVRRVA